MHFLIQVFLFFINCLLLSDCTIHRLNCVLEATFRECKSHICTLYFFSMKCLITWENEQESCRKCNYFFEKMFESGSFCLFLHYMYIMKKDYVNSVVDRKALRKVVHHLLYVGLSCNDWVPVFPFIVIWSDAAEILSTFSCNLTFDWCIGMWNVQEWWFLLMFFLASILLLDEKKGAKSELRRDMNVE